MRAAIAGMQNICGRIIAEESIAGIEGEVATLDEVFGLLRYGELAAAEGAISADTSRKWSGKGLILPVPFSRPFSSHSAERF